MLPIQQRLSNGFYAMLALPSTAMGFALSVQISALSWILTTQYHLEIEEVGLVWASGPIAGILGQVIVGAISDNVWFWKGRRRPFILIGGVLAALMLLALPRIDVISEALPFAGIVGVAIAVALTLDLAINVSFNPTRSIIADVTPSGQARTKGYTWMQSISGTFGVLAYGIGAIWDNYVLIYFGFFLVLLFSVVPTFFIEEPRELSTSEDATATGDEAGLLHMLREIRPLCGFLAYAVYGISARLLGYNPDHYYAEFAALALTLLVMFDTLRRSEVGLPAADRGRLGFQKVLAAHSFTWIGVQTMFIYMFAFVSERLPGLDDTSMGQVVSWSFLVLNAVSAILPALVLEPLTKSMGRVRVHIICIALMALGYAGLRFVPTSPLALYVLMAVVGIGWAATVSLPFAIMSQQISGAKMGLYMGLFNLSVVLPQLVASLGVGRFISLAPDKSVTMLVCALCLLVSAVAWMFVSEDQEDDTAHKSI